MTCNQTHRAVHDGNEKQRPKRKLAHMFSRRLLSFVTSGIKEEKNVLDGYDVFLNRLEGAAQTRRSSRSSLVNMAVAISDYALVFVFITALVMLILLLRVVLLDLRVSLLERGRIHCLF